MSQILWCFLRGWRGMYKCPLTSRDFICNEKEKRYRRNMMFLFAGHSAGLLSKNFVKQRLHKIFRTPAPWLTKEIIFVCTVFLSFTLRMTCERTLIFAQFTLWIAPQNLQFTLWNFGWLWFLPLVFWIDGFSQSGYCMPHSLGLIKNRTDLFSGFWERPVLRKQTLRFQKPM